MFQIQKVWMFLFLAFGFLLFLNVGNAAQTTGDDNIVCPIFSRANKTDYRDRSTAQLRWSIEDNKLNHLDKAKLRMERGEYSRDVIAEIDWTLARYPNHQVALSLLVSYSLAGGKAYDFQQPDCYFKWAREFAADDLNVLMAEAYLKWRTGKSEEAIEIYQEALKIDSQSSTAAYNIGLIFFEKKNYNEATKYAAVAYELGYPLPALRQKLADIGYYLNSQKSESP